MFSTSRSPEHTSSSLPSSPSSPELSRSKPVPTAIANVLPPCRVCGKNASGFHYGTNTCEACKGFFRRSLQREKGYVCKRSGKCWDTRGKRRKCAACRYNTCIKLGMSKRAIKTGRYSHMKKTLNTLEVTRLKQESQQQPQPAASASESQERQFQIDSSTGTSNEETDLVTGNDTIQDIQTQLDAVSESEMAQGFDMSSESGSDIEAGLDLVTSYDIASDFNVVAGSSMMPGSDIVPGSDVVAGLDIVRGSMSEFNVEAGSSMVPGSDIVPRSDIVAGLDIFRGSVSEFNVVAGSNKAPASKTVTGSDIVAGLDIVTGSDVASKYNAMPGSHTVAASDNVAGMDIVTGSDVASKFNVMPGSHIVPGADILAGLDIHVGLDVDSYIESKYQKVPLSDTVRESYSAPGFSPDACQNIVPGSDTVTCSDIVDSLDIVSGSLELLGQNIEALCDTMTQSDIVSSSDTVTPGIVTGSFKVSGCTVDASANMMPGSDSLICSDTVAVSDLVPRSKTDMLTNMVPEAGSNILSLSDKEHGSQTEVFNEILPDIVVESHDVYLSDIVAGSFKIPGSSTDEFSNMVGFDNLNESYTEVSTENTVHGSFKGIGSDIQALTDMLPVYRSLNGSDAEATDNDSETFKALSNLMPEKNIEILSDMAPRSHAVTDSDIVTSSNTLTDSNGVPVSDLGTLLQRFDDVPDIDAGLDIVTECGMAPESDLVHNGNIVLNSCVMPESDMTMLQITPSNPSQQSSYHLNQPGSLTMPCDLDLLQLCNHEPGSRIINESSTRPCSKIMIRSDTRAKPDAAPALVSHPETGTGSNVFATSTNPASQKQDITSLAFRLRKREGFDWQLNSSHINLVSQLQSDEAISTLSQYIVASSDPVIPHRPVPPTIRNSLLDITLTSAHSLTWSTEVNDFDTIASYLLEHHRKIITFSNELPGEHLLEVQRRHAKDFRLREEMFGSLTPLPLEEYLNFVEMTGIDIDNRYELVKFFIPLLERGMRKYIRFAKTIPGFKELCAEDQANLIKVGDFGFWFVGGFPGYNNDLKVVRFSNGYCFHLKELAKVYDISFISEAFRLAETFQKLPLLREEIILVKCLTVFASDRCQLRDKTKVEKIQWTIIQCLCRMLQKNHPTEPNLLARIIDRLFALGSLSIRNTELLQKFQIWPIAYQYPLFLDTFLLPPETKTV